MVRYQFLTSHITCITSSYCEIHDSIILRTSQHLLS